MKTRIDRLVLLLKTTPREKLLALAGLILATIALPLMVITSQQQQNVVQHASTPGTACSPPGSEICVNNQPQTCASSGVWGQLGACPTGYTCTSVAPVNGLTQVSCLLNTNPSPAPIVTAQPTAAPAFTCTGACYAGTCSSNGLCSASGTCGAGTDSCCTTCPVSAPTPTPISSTTCKLTVGIAPNQTIVILNNGQSFCTGHSYVSNNTCYAGGTTIQTCQNGIFATTSTCASACQYTNTPWIASCTTSCTTGATPGPTIAPTPTPTPTIISTTCASGSQICGGNYLSGFQQCNNGIWASYSCSTTSALGSYCAPNGTKVVNGITVSDVSCVCGTGKVVKLVNGINTCVSSAATPTPKPSCTPGPVTCQATAGGSFSYYDTSCVLRSGSCDLTHHCVTGTTSASGLSCVLNPGATPTPTPKPTPSPTPKPSVKLIDFPKSGSGCLNLGPEDTKGRFGDPNCDFSRPALLNYIKQLDPANWVEWYCVIGYNESTWDPNEWYGGSPNPYGAWGIFQMGSAARSNGQYDRGDVDWHLQVSNAINYRNKVIGGRWDYWQTRFDHPAHIAECPSTNPLTGK